MEIITIILAVGGSLVVGFISYGFVIESRTHREELRARTRAIEVDRERQERRHERLDQEARQDALEARWAAQVAQIERMASEARASQQTAVEHALEHFSRVVIEALRGPEPTPSELLAIEQANDVGTAWYHSEEPTPEELAEADRTDGLIPRRYGNGDGERTASVPVGYDPIATLYHEEGLRDDGNPWRQMLADSDGQ